MREISAVATVRADREAVDGLLAGDLDGIIGRRESTDDASASGRLVITMALGDGTTVSQEVAVELGRPVRGAETTSWPLSWEPVGHRALVPRFAGRLEVREQHWDTSLALVGSYRAPLGPLGALGDNLVHDRAEAAISDLLHDIASRIDDRADTTARAAFRHRSAPEAFDLPDRARRR